MSDSPIPPLDPAIKEHLDRFGDLMMNRFDCRITQLIEHLAAPPSPKGNPNKQQGEAGEQRVAAPNGRINNPPNGVINNPQGGNVQPEHRLEPQDEPRVEPQQEFRQGGRQEEIVNSPPRQNPNRPPNQQRQASPHEHHQSQHPGFEGQASHRPPGGNRQLYQERNNVEHSYSRRFLNFNNDSDDDSPLAPHIVNAPRPKFKTPSLERYNEQRDPEDHVMNYKTAMRLQGATESLMCLAFRLSTNKCLYLS